MDIGWLQVLGQPLSQKKQTKGLGCGSREKDHFLSMCEVLSSIPSTGGKKPLVKVDRLIKGGWVKHDRAATQANF
jgi:hypothetical protein